MRICKLDQLILDVVVSLLLSFRCCWLALVLSGVTSEADLPTDPPAVHTAPDLAVLVDQLLED